MLDCFNWLCGLLFSYIVFTWVSSLSDLTKYSCISPYNGLSTRWFDAQQLYVGHLPYFQYGTPNFPFFLYFISNRKQSKPDFLPWVKAIKDQQSRHSSDATSLAGLVIPERILCSAYTGLLEDCVIPQSQLNWIWLHPFTLLYINITSNLQ